METHSSIHVFQLKAKSPAIVGIPGAFAQAMPGVAV
jgi:hypothetical protein